MREITIRLPKLKKPSNKVLIVTAALVVIVSGAAVAYFFNGPKEAKQQQAPEMADAQDVEGQATQAPEYQMLLPAGKPIANLGGFARVSPPDKEPVFAFADKIGDVPVTVSQQPLPDAFKLDTQAELAKLAEQFSATEKITADNTTAYIGTSKDGPQSVITAKSELLILIKSSGKVSRQDWIAYIQRLE